MEENNNEKYVYIVTYWLEKLGYEPVVNPFDNEEAAKKCYEYFKRHNFKVCLDKAKIFSSFTEIVEE